jgi:hypothetical protein
MSIYNFSVDGKACAAKFIQHDIAAVKWLQPQIAPAADWKVFFAPTWDKARKAAGVAARDAARDAGWSAARNAGWSAARDAACEAAEAAGWSAAAAAAGSAARSAARDAAWAAAGDAGWDADAKWDEDAEWDAEDALRAAAVAGAVADAVAEDAGWSAELMGLMMCFDLAGIEQRHKDYAVKRWAAWRNGYGVRCDVNGQLYCYAKSCNLTVDQAAEKLGVSASAVKKYCASGLIPRATQKQGSHGLVWSIPEVCLIGLQLPKRGRKKSK